MGEKKGEEEMGEGADGIRNSPGESWLIGMLVPSTPQSAGAQIFSVHFDF